MIEAFFCDTQHGIFDIRGFFKNDEQHLFQDVLKSLHYHYKGILSLF
jgi:hypothetical protein